MSEATRIARARMTLRRFWALALDEIRWMNRSRTGRLGFDAYACLVLSTPAFYLLLRSQLVVPFPLCASDAIRYIHVARMVYLALIVALAHDVFTRGDHEGWQEGLASLPAGEMVWMAGRTAGRFLWILAVLFLPWLAAWAMMSLWARHALDVVPFASAFATEAGLALLLLFPVCVLAGCVGNSVIGAFVVVFFSFVLINVLGGGIARLVFDSDRVWTVPFSVLTREMLDRSSYDAPSIRAYFFSFQPDPGRSWPLPAATDSARWTLRLAAACWCVYLAAAPFLVRLRRRAGGWRVRVPGVPTFSRWASELLSATRPVSPESRAARVTSAVALAGLASIVAVVLVLGARMRGDELALAARENASPTTRLGPEQFIPEDREIDVAMGPDGAISGRERLRGRPLGRPDRPLPFLLAPGLRLLHVVDGNCRPLAFRREIDRVYVSLPRQEFVAIDFAFAGTPRGIDSITKYSGVPGLGQYYWNPYDPLLLPPYRSGIRRWCVNLNGLAWAPEPTAGPGDAEARNPCWGTTSLSLTVPARLTPIPLPGSWRQETRDGVTRCRWSGQSAFLPPVCAGAFDVRERSGRPSITATFLSQGADVDGLFDAVASALGRGPFPVAGLEDIVVAPSFGWRQAWWWSSSAEPNLANPAGLIRLSADTVHERSFVSASRWTEREIEIKTTEARSRARYDRIARRLPPHDPALPRQLVWSLCGALETWPPKPGALVLQMGPSHGDLVMRNVDLTHPPDPTKDPLGLHDEKLRVVGTALASIMGPDRIDAALRALANGDGMLDVDSIWNAVVGSRSAELESFRAEILLGRGLAAPRITGVDVKREGDRWRIMITAFNEGTASIRVTARVIAAEGAHDVTLELAAGATATATVDTRSMPDEVRLDPDRAALRLQLPNGAKWSRTGGLL